MGPQQKYRLIMKSNVESRVTQIIIMGKFIRQKWVKKQNENGNLT